MDFRESAITIKSILGLGSEPVAVRFYEGMPDLEGFELPGPRRYCQLLMGARQGRRLLLTAGNIACPAATWAFGSKEPPAKLSSGEMPAAMGVFGSAGAARYTLEIMPRLPAGKYGAVACCPLSLSPFQPDGGTLSAIGRTQVDQGRNGLHEALSRYQQVGGVAFDLRETLSTVVSKNIGTTAGRYLPVRPLIYRPNLMQAGSKYIRMDRKSNRGSPAASLLYGGQRPNGTGWLLFESVDALSGS